MNMVRIRHIMEMRRACKAPPLLPPKLRKETSESSDRRVAKDILDINFRVQIISPERFSSRFCHVQFYESQDGSEGPWNMITSSEKLEIDETYELEEIFAIEYSFERLQWIRLEIFENSENEQRILRSSEVFNIAQISMSTLSLIMTDQSGYRLAEIDVWSQLREKSQPIVMQIEAKNISTKFASYNSNIYFEIYKLENGIQKKLVYRSELAKQPKLIWKPFTIQSEDIYGESENKIQIFCVSEEEGIIGQTIICSEVVKTTDPIPFFNEAYKQGRKSCGEIRVTRCQQMRTFSFLDYIRSGTTLRFGFAIDFSVRDQFLSREEHLQFANDVEFAVKCIGEVVEPFNSSNSYLSYGFGAKIPPQNRESNNFCLSLDVEASCQGVNGVLSSFMNCYQRVQPLSTAKFSQIIYHLARNSQNGFNRENSSSTYFVLFIITRGSIDDLKETVQAAIFSSKSPISIIFVGVGCEGLDEIERIGSAGKRLEYQGRKSERDNLQFVNATKTRLECDNIGDMKSKFLEKSIQQIPYQLTSFFVQNHVVPGKGADDASFNSRPNSTLGRESSSVEQFEFGGEFDDDYEEPPTRYDPRSQQRANSGDLMPRSRRKGLSPDMRSLTIDDSSRHF